VALGGGFGVDDDAPHVLVQRLAELALMVDVEQFGALVAVEEQPLAVEQFQRVVFGRVVRGGDGDAARGADVGHIDLRRGRGSNADLDHLAAGGEQAAGDGAHQHFAGGARVAGHHHRARPDVRAESLREGAGEVWRQELAHHAPDAGDADLELVHAAHAE